MILKKGTKFQWTDRADLAFNKLKDSLTSPPILAFPDPRKSYIITTDASQFGLGFVLSQIDDEGRERPIEFGGKSLNDCERRLAPTNLEALAVVTAVKKWHYYLYSKKVYIITDHQPLQYIFKQSNLSGRAARFAIFMQNYNYEVIYKPGKKISNADCLSRTPSFIQSNPPPSPIQPQSHPQSHPRPHP